MKNIENMTSNEGWFRDDLATYKAQLIDQNAPVVMKGNPCNDHAVKDMIKSIQYDGRKHKRNITKQAYPMNEVLMKRLYMQFLDDNGHMEPHNLQLWAMMTISFFFCLRCNETLLVKFGHLSFERVLNKECIYDASLEEIGSIGR
jgi:hypothetical protein